MPSLFPSLRLTPPTLKNMAKILGIAGFIVIHKNIYRDDIGSALSGIFLMMAALSLFKAAKSREQASPPPNRGMAG